jgi:hypothetical protein
LTYISDEDKQRLKQATPSRVIDHGKEKNYQVELENAYKGVRPEVPTYRLNATMQKIESDRIKWEAMQKSMPPAFISKPCIYGCNQTCYYENKYIVNPIPLSSQSENDYHICETVEGLRGVLKHIMKEIAKVKSECKGYYGQR